MAVGKARAIVGVDRKRILHVLERARAMHAGFDAHPVDYPAPTVGLPAFLALIQNLDAAQQVVPWRTVGAAAERNEQRDLLWTGMELQRGYVQALADASPARSVSLILNAGLLVAASTARGRPMLALKLGKQPGTVTGEANLGLLGLGTKLETRQRRRRFLSWEYTLDGGRTFVVADSTVSARTVLHGLPPLTEVGVRVSLTNSRGQGAWSHVETITTIR
jgi:hypothetical protein